MTKMRGILTPSAILDYLTKEDIEEKIEGLLEKDFQIREKRKKELHDMLESSMSREEKAEVIKDMVNESFSGKETVEQGQRLAALQIRQDYAEFKKQENRAFKALLAGKFSKYNHCIDKAAEAADSVDAGLEFLEFAPEFFSQLKVTNVKFLSKEEVEQKKKSKTLYLGNIEELL
jgi:uncharacterized membrane protein YheB (UPF0754 family)